MVKKFEKGKKYKLLSEGDIYYNYFTIGHVYRCVCVGGSDGDGWADLEGNDGEAHTMSENADDYRHWELVSDDGRSLEEYEECEEDEAFIALLYMIQEDCLAKGADTALIALKILRSLYK